MANIVKRMKTHHQWDTVEALTEEESWHQQLIEEEDVPYHPCPG